MMRAPLVRRQVVFTLSFFAFLFLAGTLISALGSLKHTVTPEVSLSRIGLCLAAFIPVILGGWFSFELSGGFAFGLAAAVLVFLAGNISRSPLFVWFIAEYAALSYLLFKIRDNFDSQYAAFEAEYEKSQNEKNALEVSYRTKGEGISIFFEKYSTYYHLRKTAEELSTTLSVAQVCQIIVSRTTEFVSAGDAVLIAIADTQAPEGGILTVAAWKAAPGCDKNIPQEGDLFDEWVVKHNKRLIVNDTHQDFRFDLRQTVGREDVRSLIAVPLLHGGRVLGTLRIHSARTEAFTNDDLRLLDAIGALASSAISNAKLYEKTEELAIRDSLTGLFVRRHFFERFKQEHRRLLLTKRTLALLMCDLDYFKACNDRFGHGAGDLMLIRFAQLMRESTEEGAILCRYGGEEFAVLIPDTTREEALAAAEKIRKRVEREVFELRRERVTMTVSTGVAFMPEETLDVQALVEKADKALYRAKALGRNRVCTSES